MFEIGEKIVYGSMGVCEVQDVAPMDFGGGGEKELYYVLRPLYQDGVIYAPVKGAVYMRPILSAQEVNRLMNQFNQSKQLMKQLSGKKLGRRGGFPLKF